MIRFNQHNERRTHNWVYVPPVSISERLGLVFDLQRTDPNDNDVLNVRLGDSLVGTSIALTETDPAFVTHCIPKPYLRVHGDRLDRKHFARLKSVHSNNRSETTDHRLAGTDHHRQKAANMPSRPDLQ
jgi:hypothetical protein